MTPQLWAKKGSYRLNEIFPVRDDDVSYFGSLDYLPVGIPLFYAVVGDALPFIKMWPRPAYGIEIELVTPA